MANNFNKLHGFENKSWNEIAEDYSKAYSEWMYNPKNSFSCEDCPENKGFEAGRNGVVGPCGQQNCWVDIHCKEEVK